VREYAPKPPTSSRQEQEDPLKEGQSIALIIYDLTPFFLIDKEKAFTYQASGIMECLCFRFVLS
jgi:hypothetical protein